MKRCIICGNVGSDDSTVCEVCGNPYLDIRESNYSAEDEQMDDADVVYEEDAATAEDTYKEENDEQEDADMIFMPETAKENSQAENVNAEDDTAESEAKYEPLDVSERAEEEDLAYVPQQEAADADDSEDASLYEVPRMQTVQEEQELAEEVKKQAVPLRGEPHIYGQSDSERSGAKRMTSGAIRREMGRAYEGSRADAPARGAARPADIRRPAQMSGRTQRSGRPEGRNAAAGQRYEAETGAADGGYAAQTEANTRRPAQAGTANGRHQTQAGAVSGRRAGQAQTGAANGRPVQPGAVNGGRAPQSGIGNGGRPMQNGAESGRRPAQINGAEYAGSTVGSPNGGQGAPNRGPASVRPVNVQGGPVNMQNRPAGAYVNAARPVNYAAQRLAMTARGALKSPLLILVALMQTVYLAGSVMAVFLKQVDFSQAARLLSNVNFPAQMASYMNSVLNVISKLGSGAIVANLIPRIPELLLCIGLWLTVIAARTKKEKMSGTGLGLWKAYVIIGMIGACIVMLAGLVISVALVVSAWVAGSKSVIAVSAIVLILLIVATMLVVMYYFSYLATLKTFRKNANGEVYGTASGYVAVIHIIAGVFGIISLLSGIVNAEIGTIISAAGQISWMVLFGVWIFQYRTKLSGEEE